MEAEMKPWQCPHGGYNEKIDLTVEPWATLAPLCWDNPSSFRMGWAAEEHGVSGNPFKSQFARGVFEAGRQRCRAYGTSNTKTLPAPMA
jgi:hypothetical protein